MPFTGSHPAAVLPLLRLTRGRVALVPSALVIGSLSPDLGYYVPVPVSADVTHSWLGGVAGVDVLLGLAVFVVWQALLAPALVVLSPGPLRRRLPAGAGAGLRRFARPHAVAMTLLSLMVGAATHVGWDAFTHDGRWGAEHIGWLAAQHGRYTGAEWAQVASSAAGLAVMAVWVLQWWRRTVPVAEPAAAVGRRLPGVRARVAASAVVVGAAVAGAAEDGVRAWLAGGGPHSLSWHVLTGAGSSGGAAVLVVALLTLALTARREPVPVRVPQR